MIIAIIVGYFAGAALAFYASKWLLETIAARTGATAEHGRWIRLVGGLFGAIALAPAVFLAMMVGGLLGGRYDDAVAAAVGLGESVDLIVPAVRIALVTTLTVAINAGVGGGIGYLMGRALQKDPSLAE